MLLRRVLKTAAATMLATTRVDRLIHRLTDGSFGPVVIGYHRVVDDFASHAAATIPAMLTSRCMLECHLQWLAQHFRFVSLDEVGEHYLAGRRFDQPVVAVTFDDGYRDVYEQGLPLLVKYRVPAAVFVTTDFIERQTPLSHDRLYQLVRHALTTERGRQLLASLYPVAGLAAEPMEDDSLAYLFTTALLGRVAGATVREVIARLEAVLGVRQCLPQPLTWRMLAEMHDYGITVGLHTASHAVLTRESAETVAEELSRSRQTLERRLGTTARHLAYPDGRFNRGVLRAVMAAGIPLAYTTCRHRDPKAPQLTIARRLLWEHSSVGPAGAFSPGIMSGHVRGLFEYFTPCAEDHLAEQAVAETGLPSATASRAIATSN
jgi:peptidoglycan/xylan/chitin deacetylase (PgdA/CDA1 family)